MKPSPLVPADPWLHLRQHTAARIALGRAGGSLPTRELLRFNADHAAARDAVQAVFEAESLIEALRPLDATTLLLDSAAPDRPTHLRRPELGRRLSDESREKLTARRTDEPLDLVVIVSDGLSAPAAELQGPPTLEALWPLLNAAGWRLGPLCVVRFGRVGLMDEIGSTLNARLALILLGERPGLGSPDSLGAYFGYDPRPGRTDAERNCISNIRPAGLPPRAAAARIFALLERARSLGLSGVALKDA